jgi:hypothetical protein
MQSTESLIFEYGRTPKNSQFACRARKRIRQRARKGDKLAINFLGASFKPGSIVAIRKQLREFMS